MKPCEYGCGTPVTYVLLGYDEERKRIWSPLMESTVREVKRKRAQGSEYAPVEVREVFVLHECEAGKQAKAEARAKEQVMHAIRTDNARRSAKAWEVALLDACPKCDAAVGEKCLNLSKIKRGEVAHVFHPHAERLPEGWPGSD